MNKLTINFQEGELPSLNPHDLLIYLRGISITKWLFEGLTRIDEHGKIHLAGAESLDISEDRLRYTFTLRENKWSNGAPVTAQHYANAWKAALSPTSTCSRANLLYIIKMAEKAKRGEVPLDAVGIRAIDDKTLVVDLDYPSSFFLDLLAQPICTPLFSPKERQVTLFNGPFTIKSWERDRCLKLERNPYFWNKKKVSLDEIHVLTVADSATIFNLYETGQLDWIGLPHSPLTAEQVQHFQTKNQLISRPIERSFWIHLNVQHPVLSCLAIRKALSLALNRTTIARHILIGGPPLRRAVSDLILPVKMKPSVLLREDLKEAEKCFQQGLKELGLSKEQFPPITIAFAQQTNRKKLAEYLQETWKHAFGIDVRVEQQEWNVLRRNLERGLFDISGVYEASCYHDPMEMLEKLGDVNPANFSQWIHDGYRGLLETARREFDPESRFQILGKAEEILLQELPFIPVCTDQFIFAHRPGLKGYSFDSVGAFDLSYASLK